MSEADARIEIEGDRAVILAVIGTLRVGSTVVESLPADEWNLEQTQIAMADIGEEVVRQFKDTVPEEAVEREQVLIEAGGIEEIVSLDVEGWDE